MDWVKESLVADVIIESPGLHFNKPYSYTIPVAYATSIRRGMRVIVPFRQTMRAGVVWDLHTQHEHIEKLRPIAACVDDDSVLTPDLLELASWLCERYACQIQDALGAILPGAFRVKGRLLWSVAETADLPDDVRKSPLWVAIQSRAQEEKELIAQLGTRVKEQLALWLHAGYLRQRLEVREQVRQKTQAVLVALEPSEHLRDMAEAKGRKSPKQAELLRQLADSRELTWDKKQFTAQQVKPLVEQGVVRIDERFISRFRWVAPAKTQAPDLTETQARALRQVETALSSQEAQTVVIHGVTGSGKTEVYIKSIERALEGGGQAIVLVPEISLTPQMVGRFFARFGERIAVLHSGLTQGERRDEWGRILRGEAQIVIGARSAVFAPVQQLSLLIVDEEHEPSYKQEESPHYDAREVAIARAKKAGAVVVFGSATPSLWALRRVEQGEARLVTLPTRVNQRPLPTVEMVDMRDEIRHGNASVLSDRLREEIEQTVALGQQVILFLNRRGYASSMLCRACGEQMHCPHCDISLTVHRNNRAMKLVCHYCGYQCEFPNVCPACQEPAMRVFGLGTEQIEEAVSVTWPNYRTLRMDVDTTRKRGSMQSIVETFERGDADVLIGTQMIAKGLDFPRVRLVGVIAADTMLAVPDYRANERTFQLLTQVAGRAGRAETDGLTIIQTYRPDHYAIQTAAQHDFAAFYREERTQREFFTYPPFCELTVFVATHEEERYARGAAERFERELKRHANPATLSILPASPSGIRRIEDKYRYQVVLKYQGWEDVRDWIEKAYLLVKERMNPLGGTCRLDVNAQRIG